MTSPRYPGIRVQTASANPLALVSAVRHALRQAGAPRGEIDRFNQEAASGVITTGTEGLSEICRRWVAVERPAVTGTR